MNTSISKVLIKSTLFVLVVIGASTLAFLAIIGKIGGPDHKQAFAEVFERETPPSVSNIQYEYYSHLKGYGFYLSFTAAPEDLKNLFDFENARPLYVDGTSLVDMWSAKEKFEQLHDGDLPDLKRALIAHYKMSGSQKEVVLIPDSRQFFCFYVADSDLE